LFHFLFDIKISLLKGSAMSNPNNILETSNPIIVKVVEALKRRKITGIAAEDATHAMPES
jgi:hypothetical protein